MDRQGYQEQGHQDGADGSTGTGRPARQYWDLSGGWSSTHRRPGRAASAAVFDSPGTAGACGAPATLGIRRESGENGAQLT